MANCADPADVKAVTDNHNNKEDFWYWSLQLSYDLILMLFKLVQIFPLIIYMEFGLNTSRTTFS